MLHSISPGKHLGWQQPFISGKQHANSTKKGLPCCLAFVTSTFTLQTLAKNEELKTIAWRLLNCFFSCMCVQGGGPPECWKRSVLRKWYMPVNMPPWNYCFGECLPHFAHKPNGQADWAAGLLTSPYVRFLWNSSPGYFPKIICCNPSESRDQPTAQNVCPRQKCDYLCPRICREKSQSFGTSLIIAKPLGAHVERQPNYWIGNLEISTLILSSTPTSTLLEK